MTADPEKDPEIEALAIEIEKRHLLESRAVKATLRSNTTIRAGRQKIVLMALMREDIRDWRPPLNVLPRLMDFTRRDTDAAYPAPANLYDKDDERVSTFIRRMIALRQHADTPNLYTGPSFAGNLKVWLQLSDNRIPLRMRQYLGPHYRGDVGLRLLESQLVELCGNLWDSERAFLEMNVARRRYPRATDWASLVAEWRLDPRRPMVMEKTGDRWAVARAVRAERIAERRRKQEREAPPVPRVSSIDGTLSPRFQPRTR